MWDIHFSLKNMMHVSSLKVLYMVMILRFADYLTKGQFIEDFQSMKKKDNFDLEKIYAC